MEITPSYTGSERRLIDPKRQQLKYHALRSIAMPGTEGKTRFGNNSNARSEDIQTIDAAQLQGGEPFRTEVLAVLACLGDCTPEELNMIPILEASYTEMVKGLTDKEIPLAGMPTWDEIQDKLTKNHLAKALLMRQRGMEPRLVLTPPQTRQQLVTAIDAHKVEDQIYDTSLCDFTNNYLFSSGVPEPSPSNMKWGVDIMETVTDVADDETITGLNKDRANAWVAKIKALGLELVNDARLYESAVIQALSAGRKLDVNTITVLNAKTRQQRTHLGLGCWSYYQLILGHSRPDSITYNLRARAKVRVAME